MKEKYFNRLNNSETANHIDRTCGRLRHEEATALLYTIFTNEKKCIQFLVDQKYGRV